ncbi:helix-turn-helix domain-containing protein [Faecalispora jeddahensis]|uniref:helix-turn-helix domain-containing protein n=1 Tax=Faecalispora jeddahensis TaxID=1414721 RepID=UPI0028AEC05F|nr:helix-turn-helix transcriptional regulator [Faecalispora jeddahensis]
MVSVIKNCSSKRIRDLREDRDLTQRQVAEFLLCDQSLYSKYERGEREIPLTMMVKLAQLYHTSVDYLVGLTDDSRPYR